MIYLPDKNIAVIGVDTGYGNVKTANTIDRVKLFWGIRQQSGGHRRTCG